MLVLIFLFPQTANICFGNKVPKGRFRITGYRNHDDFAIFSQCWLKDGYMTCLTNEIKGFQKWFNLLIASEEVMEEALGNSHEQEVWLATKYCNKYFVS